MAYNEQLAQRLRLIAKDIPGLVEKKMFGGIGYLVNGNMAFGISGEKLMVRLPAAETDSALAQPHVHVFDMTGRPMKGWVLVDTAGIANDRELQGWVERGLHFALGLPPK